MKPILALLAAFLLAGTAAAQSPNASQEQFTEAFKIFQQARGGDSGRIEPAVAAFEALVRADPKQPLYAAYLGSALGLKAGDAWMPWTRMRYSEQGLDQIDQALAALKPEHDKQLLRGVPVSVETRFVAAITFVKMPDVIFHRRSTGRKLFDELLKSPAFAAAPAEFRVAVQRAADAEKATAQ